MQFATKNRSGEHFQQVLIDIDALTPLADASHKLRVSNPTSIFDSQLQYDNLPLIWESKITGSGTDIHDPAIVSARMTVTPNASDSVIRQTKIYHRYQPGKSQQILTTFTFGQSTIGVIKRAGYFDSNNGIFLEQNGTDSLNVVVRSDVTGSIVDNKVSQQNWNTDRLDGSSNDFNKSGKNLDITKGQLFISDLQWLGVGAVRTGFVVDGEIIYVHQFNHGNIISTPFMRTANLPMRYEITTDGTNSGSMTALCAAVVNEGGLETDFGTIFAVGNADVGKTVDGPDIPILTIRPKQTFNTITNRGQIIIEGIATLGTQPAIFKIIYGGIITSGVFNSVNDHSIAEFDIAATEISGGIVIMNRGVERTGSFQIEKTLHLPLTLDIDGNHPVSPFTDNVTIVGSKISANSTVNVAFNWLELR